MYGTESLTGEQRSTLVSMVAGGAHATLTMRGACAHGVLTRPLPERLANISVKVGAFLVDPDGTSRAAKG